MLTNVSNPCFGGMQGQDIKGDTPCQREKDTEKVKRKKALKRKGARNNGPE